MKEKLTLSIEKKTIDRSKKYAKAHKKSVSSLVENFLESLSDDSDEWKPRRGSVVEKLSGSVSWHYEDEKSYEDFLEEELLEKHEIQKNTDRR